MIREIIILIGIINLVNSNEECETSICAECTTGWFPSCSCPKGYEAFGKNCEDKDECEWSSNNNCDQKCENTVGSYECSCKPDYILQDDKKTCKNIKENESEESSTEQKLPEITTEISAKESPTTTDANTAGASTTTTETVLSSDQSDESSEEAGSKESPTAPENIGIVENNEFSNADISSNTFKDARNAVLYFSVDDEIKAYTITNQKEWTIIGSLDRARSLTINGNDLFWSDTYPGRQKIVRSTVRGTDARLYVLPNHYSGMISAEDVEVDWITGNMYYVDQMLRHIGVCLGSGTVCTALVGMNVVNPTSIALNPQRGEMYWADWGTSAKISRASMDGTQASAFVSTDIVYPKGLTVDYPEQTLYWTDQYTHSLNRIMLSGSGRTVLLKQYERFQPFSLAVHKNLLYWSDVIGRSVMSCDKNTGGNVKTVVQEKENAIFGITIYDPEQEFYKAITNPCSIPRLCDDLCLLNEHQGYSCACFNNKILSNDMKSCEKRPPRTPGLIQQCDEVKNFRCGSGECIPKSFECDGKSHCRDSSDEHGRCGSTEEIAKNFPSLITSNLPCTVNNMPHNYLIVNSTLYDVDKNTEVQLEARNVRHVDVYPAKYVTAYIDDNQNLILNFKQISEKREPSKSVEMYYYSFTLRLRCFNGANINMFTKVPIIDTNTYDPLFEKPSYTFKLISTAASDFEMVQKLNRIIAIDYDVTNGKVEFSISENEYFNVAYDGVVPNSLGKKHYAKLIPKSSEIKRNVHTEIFVTDFGNPVRTGRANLHIILPSPGISIFTKTFYIGDYYSSTRDLVMKERPKLQDSANFGSLGFVLEPSTYFMAFPNRDEIVIHPSKTIPYDVIAANRYMTFVLSAGDVSSFSDSNSKTVIIINLHN